MGTGQTLHAIFFVLPLLAQFGLSIGGAPDGDEVGPGMNLLDLERATGSDQGLRGFLRGRRRMLFPPRPLNQGGNPQPVSAAASGRETGTGRAIAGGSLDDGLPDGTPGEPALVIDSGGHMLPKNYAPRPTATPSARDYGSRLPVAAMGEEPPGSGETLVPGDNEAARILNELISATPRGTLRRVAVPSGDAALPDPYDPKYQARPSFGKRLLGNLADVALGLLRRPDLGEAAKAHIEGQDKLTRQYGEDVFQAEEAAAEAKAAQQQRDFGEKSKLRGAQTFEAQSRGEEAEARANKLKEAPGDKFDRIENGQAVFTRPNGTSYARAVEGYTAPQRQAKVVDRFTNAAGQRVAVYDDGTKKIEGSAHVEPVGGQRVLSPSARAGIESKKNTRLAALEREYRQSQAGTDPMSTADLEQQKQQVQNEYERELRAGGARVSHFTYGTPGPATGRAETVEVVSPQGLRGTIPRANLQKALGRGYKLAVR